MISIKKFINIDFIVGLIVFCGLSAYSYGIYNYSLGEPSWSFSLWLIIGSISFTIVGGLLSYRIQVKDTRRVIFYLNVQTIIVSIYLITWGIEVLHKERVVIRLEHFIGADAALIGKLSVGAGIFIIISTLVTKLTKNIKKPPTPTSEVVICINCLEPYSKRNIPGINCPKCGGVLENLSGFYDRHPDLKDKTAKRPTNES